MSSDSARGSPYIGAMLRVAWQWVWEQIYAGVSDAGYGDINPAHIALFRYPSLDGLRPTEVAAKMEITKQSVNDLIGHLEVSGYVVRTPDPADGRARVLRLTSKGQRLESTINDLARSAELGIADMLGQRQFDQLRRALENLTQQIKSDPLPN